MSYPLQASVSSSVSSARAASFLRQWLPCRKYWMKHISFLGVCTLDSRCLRPTHTGFRYSGINLDFSWHLSCKWCAGNSCRGCCYTGNKNHHGLQKNLCCCLTAVSATARCLPCFRERVAFRAGGGPGPAGLHWLWLLLMETGQPDPFLQHSSPTSCILLVSGSQFALVTDCCWSAYVF